MTHSRFQMHYKLATVSVSVKVSLLNSSRWNAQKHVCHWSEATFFSILLLIMIWFEATLTQEAHSMQKSLPWLPTAFFIWPQLKKILIFLKHLEVNVSWKVLFRYKWIPFCAFKWSMHSPPLGGGLYIIARVVVLKINWMHCSRSASD